MVYNNILVFYYVLSADAFPYFYMINEYDYDDNIDILHYV